VQSLRSLIQKSGFLNSAYYRSAYRECLDGLDPLDHFIRVGQHKGYKPNPRFDPLLYLLRHPEAKQSGAVWHFLEHPENAGSDFCSVKLAFPEIQPPALWPNASDRANELKAQDALGISGNPRVMGQAEVLEFKIGDRAIRLVTPSADDLFCRLENDQPFAFPRLPHAFWDCLSVLGDIRARIAQAVPSELFSPPQLDLLAKRLSDELMPHMGVYAENFLAELLSGIQREKLGPHYLRSVSFKAQPSGNDRLFGRSQTVGPVELDQLAMVARYFASAGDLHESMMWKRWTYSGDLKRLPPLARKRPVVFVGPNRMGDLGNRWQLPLYSHLEIPLSSYTRRYDILDRCKEAVLLAKELAEKHVTKCPLVIFQGGSFAYWLIARLYEWDSSVFYLDLGQSLHIWFLDNRDLWEHWLFALSRVIMQQCELDEVYRSRGIRLRPPFSVPRSQLSLRHAPRPVYFQHLRKTAGTSLTATLKAFFRPENIAEDGFHLLGGVAIEDVLARLHDYDLVTDHSEILSAARPDAFKVAVFRNPLTRVLSERRQWMQALPENIAESPPAVAAATIALQKRSMVDILNSVFDHPVMISQFWNHQAVSLGAWPILRSESAVRRSSAYAYRSMHEHFGSGSDCRSWLLANKGRILERALHSLKSLDYVGLTEDFDVSVREIFARIGLPEPGDVVVLNAREAFDDERDPRIGEVAKHFLELDNELYEAAVERHALFGRIARGTPVDYIGRRLTSDSPLVISAEDAPGGHGWHVAHCRSDGLWSRWSGPGSQSRIALSAGPGVYAMTIEIWGASSERTLLDLQVEVEGRLLPTEARCLPDGLWTVTTTFERERHDRFDIVFRLPRFDGEHGIELKQISFRSIDAPSKTDP
jgi:hypothetical protein